MFISDTTVAVAIDYVKRCLWFLCQCFMRRLAEGMLNTVNQLSTAMFYEGYLKCCDELEVPVLPRIVLQCTLWQRFENPCVGGSIPPRATRFRVR